MRGETIAAYIALCLAVLAVMVGSLVVLAKQLAFVMRAYRVQGTVVSEWWYSSSLGGKLRYYRVEFVLPNGQRAQMRSGGATKAKRPRVGEQVPILVNERAGRDPKAQIGTWGELWAVTSMLLFLSAVGCLALWPHIGRLSE